MENDSKLECPLLPNVTMKGWLPLARVAPPVTREAGQNQRECDATRSGNTIDPSKCGLPGFVPTTAIITPTGTPSSPWFWDCQCNPAPNPPYELHVRCSLGVCWALACRAPGRSANVLAVNRASLGTLERNPVLPVCVLDLPPKGRPYVGILASSATCSYDSRGHQIAIQGFSTCLVLRLCLIGEALLSREIAPALVRSCPLIPSRRTLSLRQGTLQPPLPWLPSSALSEPHQSRRHPCRPPPLSSSSGQDTHRQHQEGIGMVAFKSVELCLLLSVTLRWHRA